MICARYAYDQSKHNKFYHKTSEYKEKRANEICDLFLTLVEEEIQKAIDNGFFETTIYFTRLYEKHLNNIDINKDDLYNFLMFQHDKTIISYVEQFGYTVESNYDEYNDPDLPFLQSEWYITISWKNQD